MQTKMNCTQNINHLEKYYKTQIAGKFLKVRESTGGPSLMPENVVQTNTK